MQEPGLKSSWNGLGFGGWPDNRVGGSTRDPGVMVEQEGLERMLWEHLRLAIYRVLEDGEMA
jgi:hypothetical protein